MSYQLIVYAGLDEAGKKTYVRETFKGPRRKAELKRLRKLTAQQAIDLEILRKAAA